MRDLRRPAFATRIPHQVTLTRENPLRLSERHLGDKVHLLFFFDGNQHLPLFQTSSWLMLASYDRVLLDELLLNPKIVYRPP
jgi:hypothetical protein